MTYSAILHRLDSDPLHFGDDEESVGDILASPEFATVAPGGFDDGQLVLTRPDELTSLDTQRLASLEIYRDGEVVYAGRVSSLSPSGDTLTVQCQGWASHLLDDETFSQTYIDRSTSRWQAVSDRRGTAILGGGYHLGDMSTVDSATAPAVITDLSGSWAEVLATAEAQYDIGPGQTIGAIDYVMIGNANVGTADVGLIGIADDDTLVNIATTSDLVTASPPSATGTFTPATPRRWATLLYQNSGTVTSQLTRQLLWQVAVKGDHGLTDAGGGYYPSDIVGHIVSGAPKLSTDTIDSASFIVPHFIVETSTRWAAVEQTSLFAGQYPEWGVYENRKFFWRKPGSVGRTWRLRRDQGAQIEWAAADTTTSCNGILVTYDPGDGRTLIVGPTGSNADYETDDLLDSSADNPWTVAGINRYKTYDAGVTSQDGAVVLGRLYLQALNDVQRSGTVSLLTVMDEGGNEYPAEYLRSYDFLVVEDADDDGATDPLPVIQTRFAGDTLTATVGRSSHVLDALRARLDTVTR